MRRLTFQSAVTMEMGASLSAFDSAMVEMIWHTAKSRHAQTKPGLITGAPCQSTKSAAKGRRKVKRPQTAMYSSSSCPSRFITVLRSTWQRAAVSARASHMRPSLHEHPGILGGNDAKTGEKRSRRRHSEVLHRHLGKEIAEVRRHSEVALLVELLAREPRPRARHPAAFDRAAQDEHGGRVTVVRPAIAVLSHGPPELRHRQDDDVGHAVAEIPVERGQTLGELHEPLRELPLLVALVGVRVPAAHVGKGDLEPHVGLDELGDLLQAVAEPALRVL